MTKFVSLAFSVFALWVGFQQLDFCTSTLATAHQDYNHVKAETLPVEKDAPEGQSDEQKLKEAYHRGLLTNYFPLRALHIVYCKEARIPCDEDDDQCHKSDCGPCDEDGFCTDFTL